MASRYIEEAHEEHIKVVEKSSSRKTANNLDNTAKKHRNSKTKTHKDGYDTNAVQDGMDHGQKSQANGKMVGLLSVTTV